MSTQASSGRPSGLAAALTGFYLLFAVDAWVSLIDDLLAWAGLGGALSLMRTLTSLGFWAASVGMGVALLATPRVPWRPILPLVLFPWVVTFLVPVPQLMLVGVHPAANVVTSGLQVLIAALVAGAVRRRGSGWWLLPEEAPAFRWRHTLVAGVGLGFLAPVGCVGGLVVEIAVAVDEVSRGFLRITPRGVELSEHLLYRDGRSVRLIAMMHIGDRDFYEALLAELAEGDALLLDEGVRDPSRRLGAAPHYDVVAEAIGLESQDVFQRSRAPRRRNADVSMDEFSDTTIAVLDAGTRIFDGGGDRLAALREYRRVATPEAWPALKADLIELRNAKVVEEVSRAVGGGHDVVVPWGAMHMPGIEAALLDQGWERGGWRTRVVVAWGE